MAFEFKLPDLGEGIHEAQVLAWKVTPGQEVKAFQPLCEVESAKAAVELTAPVAGRVLETRFAEGDTAQLGDVLVLIETDGATRPSRDDVVPVAPAREAPPA
jgi:pyruvate/2-oxoglutarate dehydrogenase complex dihydrolipoamide acyltransferase (E2) component